MNLSNYFTTYFTSLLSSPPTFSFHSFIIDLISLLLILTYNCLFYFLSVCLSLPLSNI